MPKLILEALEHISGAQLVIFITTLGASIVFLYKFAIKLYQWVKNFLQFYHIKINKMTERENLILSYKSEISEMKKTNETLRSEIAALNDKIVIIQQMILEQEQNAIQAEQVRLKDRILQSFTYYKKRNKGWNSMEFEAFQSLLSNYDKCDGNSFVHQIIQPEVATWVIKDN